MEDAYPGFATVVLPLLRPARYIKDEILASSTMSTRELTFVVSGACESVDVLSTKVLERYPSGACFGEVSCDVVASFLLVVLPYGCDVASVFSRDLSSFD